MNFYFHFWYKLIFLSSCILKCDSWYIRLRSWLRRLLFRFSFGSGFVFLMASDCKWNKTVAVFISLPSSSHRSIINGKPFFLLYFFGFRLIILKPIGELSRKGEKKRTCVSWTLKLPFENWNSCAGGTSNRGTFLLYL